MSRAPEKLGSLCRLALAYKVAKESIIRLGYSSELQWQKTVRFEETTETDFLREAAWVVLSCGMRETVVRRKFPGVSSAFFDWDSADKIVAHTRQCCDAALHHFGHEKKIKAIADIAVHLTERGFQSVMLGIQRKGIHYITQLPYMGPATSYHFAKNIGLPVAKPDRHLWRIARETGYSSPEALCADIAEIVGDTIPVVDLVLWRYATLNSNYLELFSGGRREGMPRAGKVDCEQGGWV